MPLRVSCPSPVLRIFSPSGGGSVPSSPCLAFGRSPRCKLPAFASWLCALWGRHRGAPGECLLVACGASGLGRSRSHDRPSLGLAGAVGAGGVGLRTRHQPHTARSCELDLRDVGAAPGHQGGGVSCLGVGRSGLGAHPRPSARHWGARPGPAIHWLGLEGGDGAWAPSTTPRCALLRAGSAHCGDGTRAPGRRGAGCLGVGRPGLGAPAGPTARPWGVRPGPATHWLWVRGVWAWEPVTNLAARALVCLLGALWGWHEGTPGRASVAWVWGVLGWALTHDRPPVLEACGWGLLPPGRGCGGCGRGDLSPTSRCLLLGARHARCGGGTRAPWGGAGALGVGRPGFVAHPRPTARPWGVRPGPATHLLRVQGGVGVGTHHQPHSTRSCELALRAVGAALRRPRGGISCLGVGCPGSVTHPRPTANPWGVRPGPASHWLRLQRMWAWGPVTSPTARALGTWLCALWGRLAGALRRGAGCLRVGRPELGAHPRPTACPWGVRPGIATHWLRLRGLWARGPITSPTARALASWLCAL